MTNNEVVNVLVLLFKISFNLACQQSKQDIVSFMHAERFSKIRRYVVVNCLHVFPRLLITI
jgi:hypothetical protein